MTTPDERPTQPLHTDDAPDDPGTAPLEDTMTTPPDTGPGAEHPSTPVLPAATQATPVGAAPVAPPRPQRSMRVGTMVWGLVLAAIGAGVLAWALGATFDVELAFIVLVAAAGVLLLVGSVATTLRRRR